MLRAYVKYSMWREILKYFGTKHGPYVFLVLESAQALQAQSSSRDAI
jgi:hypothetical protein